MITAKLTLGRRTITATGDTELQARGRALGAYFKKWGERAKGATFKLSGKPSGASKPASKPAAKSKGKKRGRRRRAAPAPAAPAPQPAASSRAAKKAVRLPVDDLQYGSRLIIGTTNAGTVVAALGAGDLAQARALAQSDAMKGALRVVVDIVNIYGDTGRQVEGPQRLNAAELRYLDRVVIGTKANGELLEVRTLRGDLSQARAVAQSLNANRTVVGSVHEVYRG